MKVSALIEILKALPADAEVHASGDWDGNASVWVEVDGVECYIIDPGEAPGR